MALSRTHEITISVDSKTLTARDTTPIADYISNIGVVTDEDTLLSNTSAISLVLIDDSTSTIITSDITALKDDLRTANGAEIDLSTYFSVTSLDDDLYDITMTWTIDSSDYDSNTDQFFYEDIKNDVAVAVLSTDWQDSFNYQSRSSSSKYALKLKSWLDQLTLADENSKLTEGKTILNSLKSIL